MTDLRHGFVIAFEPSIRLGEGASSVWLARIHTMPENLDRRWPTERAKPLIVLVGDTISETIHAVEVWLGEGAPSASEVT